MDGAEGTGGDPAKNMADARSRERLIERISAFEYWHYGFDLGDGIQIRSPLAQQKQELRDFIWQAVLQLCGGDLTGLRVLDVGCNAGFWSLEAHRSGAAYVLGVDARPVHIEQAELVRDALGISPTRLAYQQHNIYRLSREQIGDFDLCLALRVLQHLRHPLLALERLREVCRTYLVVDISLVPRDEPVLYLHLEDRKDPLHGVDDVALKPSMSAMERMLACTGFADVTIVPARPPLEPEYFSGERVLLTARALQDTGSG